MSPWPLARRKAPLEVLGFSQMSQKAAARISIGTLTVAQHKQRISAASLKVSGRKAELQRLRDSPDILMRDPCPPARKEAH